MRRKVADQEAQVPVGLVGCDFRVASSRWRSALVLGKEERSILTAELLRGQTVESVVFLDTCNRHEWIFAAPEPCWAGEILKAQMLKRWQEMETPLPRPYVLVADDAVRHILRVAAGLESFVVGERQITTQLNKALERARREGSSSVHLNGLGAMAARVARDVHGSASPVGVVRGVHEVATRYIARHVKTPARVLVIGTGEIGRRVVSSIQEMPGYTVLSMNRTVRRGALPLSALPATRAEAVVVCTAASTPILTARNLPPAPAVLIDLGIPSQIARDCGSVPGMRRVDLDDLLGQAEIEPVDPEKLKAAAEVVEAGLREYSQFCVRRRFVRVLDRTRRNHEDFVARVLPGFLDEFLPDGDSQMRGRLEYRLRGLFRQYTNSLFRSINDSIGQEE